MCMYVPLFRNISTFYTSILNNFYFFILELSGIKWNYFVLHIGIFSLAGRGSRSLGASAGPDRARGSVARALGAQSREIWQAIAGRRYLPRATSRAKQDNGNPYKTKSTAAAGFRMCLLRCVRVTADTSPGRLTTSHLECGRLENSHPGPSCMQQERRFELLSSCRGDFCMCCV